MRKNEVKYIIDMEWYIVLAMAIVEVAIRDMVRGDRKARYWLYRYGVEIVMKAYGCDRGRAKVIVKNGVKECREMMKKKKYKYRYNEVMNELIGKGDVI